MAAKINFKVEDSKAKKKIAALEKVAGNMQPIYETVGNVLVNRIKLCFKLGISPWNQPWAALKFRKGQPLRDTGLLQRSITAKADASGVTVGTNQMPRARVHQFGATIEPKKAKRLVFPGPGGKLIFAKKVTIPARPFMPLRRGSEVVELPPSWSLLVLKSLRQYLRGAAEKVEA
jgi:phage gpG-like protein